MLNEYMVNSADLISVANAIREKGGTNEQLVFPSEFVTAIHGIKSGAELSKAQQQYEKELLSETQEALSILLGEVEV